MALREVESLIVQQKDSEKKLTELITNLTRLSQEHKEHKTRESQLEGQVEQKRIKLIEAKAAGKLKRFFLNMDPAILQAEIIHLGSELTIVRDTITANLSKRDQLLAAAQQTKAEGNRFEREAQDRLSRYGCRSTSLSASISSLSKRAEEFAGAIRAIELELEALVAKILREAKVIATSLTKACLFPSRWMSKSSTPWYWTRQAWPQCLTFISR